MLLYEAYAILKLAEVSARSVVRQDEDNKATLFATVRLIITEILIPSIKGVDQRFEVSLISRATLAPAKNLSCCLFGIGGSHSSGSPLVAGK